MIEASWLRTYKADELLDKTSDVYCFSTHPTASQHLLCSVHIATAARTALAGRSFSDRAGLQTSSVRPHTPPVAYEVFIIFNFSFKLQKSATKVEE